MAPTTESDYSLQIDLCRRPTGLSRLPGLSWGGVAIHEALGVSVDWLLGLTEHRGLHAEVSPLLAAGALPAEERYRIDLLLERIEVAAREARELPRPKGRKR